MTSQKSNTWIEIPVKFKATGPTHNISKVSCKVYLSNANRGVQRKYVFKQRSVATCNHIDKAAKILHVKVDICKPSNNQSSVLSPNVF